MRLTQINEMQDVPEKVLLQKYKSAFQELSDKSYNSTSDFQDLDLGGIFPWNVIFFCLKVMMICENFDKNFKHLKLNVKFRQNKTKSDNKVARFV